MGAGGTQVEGKSPRGELSAVCKYVCHPLQCDSGGCSPAAGQILLRTHLPPDLWGSRGGDKVGVQHWGLRRDRWAPAPRHHPSLAHG